MEEVLAFPFVITATVVTVITVVTSVSPDILHNGLGMMKSKCRRLGLFSLWLNCQTSL